MPPRSPLPLRHGLGAAWVRTPDHGATPGLPATMREWLVARLGPQVDVPRLLSERRFVHEDGTAVEGEERCTPSTFVWFHRDLRDEPVVPGTLHVLHHDDRLVVVDKPSFLSTIPRGRHVVQSVVVRLRAGLDLPQLTPVHRLDRVTAGVLVLATERRWRAPYQRLFEQGEVAKTYRALAPWLPDLATPVTVRNHIRPVPGTGGAEVVDGVPANAETLVEVEERLGDLARYRLTPRTGRTHQLRLHLAGLGAAIVGDPLHPTPRDVDVDDFSTPLQLLASELGFTDPVDGTARCFTSVRSLPLPSSTDA